MYIVGIDEVGRGCLAGPVVVSAVCIKKGMKFPRGLKDSKKLSEKQREEWLLYIKSNKKIFCASAIVSPAVIDRINISQAANLAALRSFLRLPNVKRFKIYLDGGLYLKNKEYQKNFKAETVIKGDEKINAIKLASIVAKVKRDNLMKRLGNEFTEYCFGVHKGYATKLHRAAIKKNGLCVWHRRSFCKKFV
jgi:ribonuclease HII